MIEAVVKVGGSLGRGDGLSALGMRLAELGRRHRLLVVPGGGAFADVVREYDARFGLRPGTAHQMAILAMDQYGHLICDLAPGCVPVSTLSEADACAAGGATAVLLPSGVLRTADLPQTWSVTSDSIAAWLARKADAPLLVMLKDHHAMASLERAASASPPPGSVEIAELAATECVDGHLAGMLAEAPFDLWLVNGEHPERLGELLATGTTAGVRLGRSGL